jgi:outer membrane immunogenic protein
MRKIAALSIVLASVCGLQSASAADLGSYKDTYVAPLAPIWAGFYVGGHIGGIWDDGGDNSARKRHCKKDKKPPKDEQPKATLASVAAGPEAKEEKVKEPREKVCADDEPWHNIKDVKFGDDDDVGLLGGFHVGYNWQDGARVVGVEGDISFGDKIDYLASLRGRLGYAMDSLLIYATAGVAFVGFDDKTIQAEFDWGKKSFDISGDNDVGLVVGGGAEVKLDPNWSLGVEGLYYFFGDSEDSLSWNWRCYEKELVHEDDNDLFVIRGRLTYHFQEEAYAPLK